MAKELSNEELFNKEFAKLSKGNQKTIIYDKSYDIKSIIEATIHITKFVDSDTYKIEFKQNALAKNEKDLIDITRGDETQAISSTTEIDDSDNHQIVHQIQTLILKCKISNPQPESLFKFVANPYS